MQFIRYLLPIFLLFVNYLYAGTCSSPKATISLNDTLYSQEITVPVVEGVSGGDEFFYEINLDTDGRLVVESEVDLYHLAEEEKVSLTAQLYDSSCNLIEDLPSVGSSPKQFKMDKDISAGTYYIKVYSLFNINDDNADYATGYFQLKNSFTSSTPTYSIDIVKESNKNSVNPNENVDYTITIQNNSDINISKVVIEDSVPMYLNYIDEVHSGWKNCTQTDDKVSCELDSVLASKSSTSIVLRMRADEISSDQLVTNSVSCNVTFDDGTTKSDNASKSVTIKGLSHDIGLYVVPRNNNGDPVENVVVGHKIYYEVYIANDGNMDESNINIVAQIPNEMTLDSFDNVSEWDCSSSVFSKGGKIECKYKNTLLSVGEDAYFQAWIIADEQKENVSIDFYLSSDDFNKSRQVAIDIVPPYPSIYLQKSIVGDIDSVGSSELYSYGFYVQNNGSEDINNIKVVDVLDSDLEIVSDWDQSDSNWNCNIESHTVVCTYNSDTMSPNEDSWFEIKVKAPAVTTNDTIINKAYAEADYDEDVLRSDSNVSIDIIAPAPNLIIKKSSSKSKVVESEVFVYTIKLHNNGEALDKDINVTDSIPEDLTIENISAGSWDCNYNSQDILCRLSTLDAGKFADDINISVKAPSNILESKVVTNTAYVKSLYNDPSDKQSNSSVDVELLSPKEAVTITKKSIPETVYSGDNYSYEITIENNSESEISNIKVIDDLPDIEIKSFNSELETCTLDNDNKTLTCQNELSIKPSEKKKIIIEAIAPSSEINITNHVSLTTSLDSLTREDNATTIVKKRNIKLDFAKAFSSKDTVKVNEEFSYTFALLNSASNEENNMDAKDVNLSFRVDSNISVIDINATDWNCSESSGVISCAYDKVLIAGDTSSDINIKVKALSEAYTISEVNATADSINEVIKKEIAVDIKSIVDADLSLSIKDDHDPVDSADNYYYDVVIKNANSSEPLFGIVFELNTTSSDNFLLYDYSDNDWDCVQEDFLLTCKLNTTLSPLSTKTLRLDVKAPNITTKIDLQATVSSEFVNDINISNNTVFEDTRVEDIDYTGDNPRDFTKVVIDGKQDINIFGDIITIGNQSICEQKVSGVCNEPSFFVNDLIEQKYINIDSSYKLPPYTDSLLNSTKANLNIQSTDEIIWAGLYWMGRIDKTIPGYEDKIKNAKKVLFRHSSDELYKTYYAADSAKAIDINGSEITVNKFNYINSSDYFDYQGMQDVTEYVKKYRKGDYYVANIQSSEGYNLSAGWNLVVIVRDNQAIPTKTLKNITIFDGFQGVWKPSDGSSSKYPTEVTQEVSGFLTPLDGVINSKVIFFGFEGDKTLHDYISITDAGGIKHELTNDQNPSSDVVNGTIFSSERFPSLTNTSGIDIDMFDVSSIMNNNQTSTKITIGSNGDRFFLGMFAFSTDLYETMCYMQTFKDSNFSSVLDASSDLHLGDEIGIEAEIRYQEIYKIDDVKAISVIDKVFKEDNSSFELMNVSESSFSKQDELFSFTTTDDNNTKFFTNVGIDSSASSGGYFDNKQSVYIRYRAILDQLPPDSNITNNIYMINYGGSDKEIMLKPCTDFNQSLKIKENTTNGFNVTRYFKEMVDENSDGIDDRLQFSELNNTTNHLYTQVQNIGFKSSIISLDADKYNKGLVQLEVVETNSTDECKDMNLMDNIGIIDIDANIVNISDILIDNAHKEVTFRVSYPVDSYGKYVKWESASDRLQYLQKMVESSGYSPLRCESECESSLSDCQECVFKTVEDGGLSRVSCARDIFSVKPNKIYMDLNGSKPYIGGKIYKLNFDANSSFYDQNITSLTGSLDYNLSNPAGCMIVDSGDLLKSNNIKFVKGLGVLSSFSYANIGDIEVHFEDRDWTKYDQNLTDPLYSDCIVGSDTNIADSNGKVGCNISTKSILSFKPAGFKSKLSLKGFHSGSFAYISNDKEMASEMNITVRAVLDDGNIATNYTKGCFAKDIKYSFDLNESTLEPREKFFDENNFENKEGNFTNGETNFLIGINFDRNSSFAENPFILSHDMIEFNVSEKLDANVSGINFALGSDGNVTYYYARLYAPDYMGIDTDEKNVTLFYEVYCNGCDKSKFNLSGLYESKDYVNWLVFNARHLNSSFGTYSGEKSLNKLNVSAISDKKLALKLGSLKAPYCDKIIVNPSSWLSYRKFSSAINPTMSFKSCFVSNGGWAGKGKVGVTVDTNVSIRENKSIDW